VSTDHAGDVVLLEWPAEHARRAELQASQVPCLLIVDDDTTPPCDTTGLEDWARRSADPHELQARLNSLVARASSTQSPRPRIDQRVILRWRNTWVALRPIEALLTDELAAHFGQVVPREDLERVGWGHPVGGRALDLQMVRLRRRIHRLGLAIETIRGNGYMLVSADA
jgi:DNA-binding response OmpR family regulator